MTAKRLTPEEMGAIEKILGKQLWQDGVYVADSLDIVLTIFQLRAIIQLAKVNRLASDEIRKKELEENLPALLETAHRSGAKEEKEKIEKSGIDIVYQPDRLDRPVVTTKMNFEAINMLFKNKLKITSTTRGRLIFLEGGK